MERRKWNRIVAWMFSMGFRYGVIGLVVTDTRSAPAEVAVDTSVEQRLLVEQFIPDKAITVARERWLVDAEQEKFNELLRAKDQVLRAAETHAPGNAVELPRMRQARDKIASERHALIATLAHQGRTLTAEVRVHREVVTGIATSPDPWKQKALQRSTDSERREALTST